MTAPRKFSLFCYPKTTAKQHPSSKLNESHKPSSSSSQSTDLYLYSNTFAILYSNSTFTMSAIVYNRQLHMMASLSNPNTAEDDEKYHSMPTSSSGRNSNSNSHSSSYQTLSSSCWYTFHRNVLWLVVMCVLILPICVKNFYRWTSPTNGIDPRHIKVKYDIYSLRDGVTAFEPPFNLNDLVHHATHIAHVPGHDSLSDVITHLQEKFTPAVENRYSDYELVFALVRPFGVNIKKASKWQENGVYEDEKEIYLKSRRDSNDDSDDDKVIDSSFYHSQMVKTLFGGEPYKYVLRAVVIPCRGKHCFHEMKK